MKQKPRPRREFRIYDDPQGGGVSASLLLSIAALVISSIALVLTLTRPGTAAPSPTEVANASIPLDLGTPVPEATLQHFSPDLEAMLPKTLGGTTLDRQSTNGVTGLGDDTASQALSAWLTTVSKTPADLEIAEAYDSTGTVETTVIGFRLNGVAGTDLSHAVLDSWLAGAASGVVSKTETIGGKTVTHVTYGDGGPDDYVYIHGSAVFDVGAADPTLAAEALKALP